MGSGNHVVIDVNSDEEELDTRVDIDYSSWLNEVMEVVDEKSDSTDVVEVLSEVKGGVDSQYRNPNFSSQAVDDDEDCVILDGDPDRTTKTASIDDDDKIAKNDEDDDDDDVLVVGQKGEIACRDFPHPRHSCAKYSFNSTSHEKYCDMCHCYVCDIRAPCPYWCVGVSSIDHCHANDKEKIWKNQREYFRTGYMPTPPSSKPTQNMVRITQKTLPRNQVGIRPCSSSTRVANPSNVRARHRIRQSIPHNQGLQNQPVQSLISVRSSMIQKDRSSSRLNLRSRLVSSAGNGNSTQVGLYSNAQVSQSSHHSSSIVAPTLNPEMYIQQGNYQPNVSAHCTAVPGSQSNVYTRHSDQSISGSGNRQFQKTVDLFTPPEAPAADSQTETAQQQPGTNENVLETKLSDFENWLMDNSIQTGPVSPLPEPVGQDYVGTKKLIYNDADETCGDYCSQKDSSVPESADFKGDLAPSDSIWWNLTPRLRYGQASSFITINSSEPVEDIDNQPHSASSIPREGGLILPNRSGPLRPMRSIRNFFRLRGSMSEHGGPPSSRHLWSGNGDWL